MARITQQEINHFGIYIDCNNFYENLWNINKDIDILTGDICHSFTDG